MKLHLGVIDAPYVPPALTPSGKSSKAKWPNKTTGDVADILEAKYHVMEVFDELHHRDIVADLERSLKAATANLAVKQQLAQSGAKVRITRADIDPYRDAEQQIGKMFRDFITGREMDGLFNGVPTKAALKRKSARFKSGVAPKERPSFVDTGLYEASFRAWIEY
jgi:hypothetical protein